MNKNKKVAIVIAFRGFKDEEFLIPKGILEKAGIKTIVISNKQGVAIGSAGTDIETDLLLEDLDVSGVDAVVFVGGQGALDNLDNEKSYRIARQAVEKDKILGAICISPVILAKAGVLKEKKATVWSPELGKGPARILEDCGAFFIAEKNVVRDGKIITGNGPQAAKDFGETIVDSLQ